MKKPWLAGLLNIVPGVGYLYVGVRKTFSYLLLLSLAIAILECFIYSEVWDWYSSAPITWLCVIYLFLFLMAFILDGYNEAKNIKSKSDRSVSKTKLQR